MFSLERWHKDVKSIDLGSLATSDISITRALMLHRFVEGVLLPASSKAAPAHRTESYVMMFQDEWMIGAPEHVCKNLVGGDGAYIRSTECETSTDDHVLLCQFIKKQVLFARKK